MPNSPCWTRLGVRADGDFSPFGALFRRRAPGEGLDADGALRRQKSPKRDRAALEAARTSSHAPGPRDNFPVPQRSTLRSPPRCSPR